MFEEDFLVQEMNQAVVRSNPMTSVITCPPTNVTIHRATQDSWNLLFIVMWR